MPLTIIANIYAAAGQEERVERELIKLIDMTRQEEGCLQYDLHKDNNKPGHFVFYESWENRELWQTHMGAPHLGAYLRATEGAVETFEVYEMQKVGE